ncbi:MAG: acylphosphatase [Thaumarchaeota archaeon]|nr:acylphosphatase [Nitrososphaerota archaeon]
MPRIAVRLKIFGLVHGVFFRASMAEVAATNAVAGWVRNKEDGTVDAFLEGEEAHVRRVLEWAKRGPARARVDSIRVEKTRTRNSRGFRIEG